MVFDVSATSQDAGEVQNMGDLLDSIQPLKPLRRGDVVDGVVMRSDSEGALINIGHKAEGRVPLGEMKTVEREGQAPLKIGDEVVAFVVRGETAEEAAILSIDRAVGEQGWRTLAKAMESGERVTGTVLGFNRGGAIVEAEGVQCFVPMSQLVTISRDNFREFRRQATQSPASDSSADDGVRAPEAGPGEAEDKATEAAETEATGAETAETKAVGAETTETEATDTEVAETEASDAETAETEAEGPEAAEAEATGTQAVETEAGGAEVAETEAEGTEAAEAESGEVETAAAEAEDSEAESGEAEPATAEAAEAEPVEAEPATTDAAQTEEKVAEQPSDIGKELELKVLEVNRSRNRAILSERSAIQEQREERKAKLIQELTEGEVRTGTVTGISSFGAFVDLGGADGLVHISELSWNPVRSPEEVVRTGQEVQVYVLRVDAENNKIALSLKRLQREPWETIADELEVGEIVDATVTKLTDFGAFAKLEGSVEGLIHISEMSSSVISHPREVVREGDEVRLKVLRIEPERRRLGLSLRQALEVEGEAY